MKTFLQYITERDAPSRSIHYFDVDGTLSSTSKDVKVHVKDKEGKTVQSLSHDEFNTHKLEPGHHYDFHEFQSSDKFKVHPIRKMLAKMKAIHKNGGNAEILTARSDFDDKAKFAGEWGKVGVDIGKGGVHVRRAGNMRGMKPHEAKAKIISDAIKRNGHKEVHLYDDSIDNINSMLALKKEHPGVTFHGHHVQHDEETGQTTVKHYRA